MRTDSPLPLGEGLGVRAGNRATDKRVYLPLYEAKMMHQFDHRWATYDGDDVRDFTLAEKQDPSKLVMPRYWVEEEHVETSMGAYNAHQWFLAHRKTARSTDERTLIVSPLMRTAVGDKAPLIFIEEQSARTACLLTANFNSYVCDFTTRQKLGGTDLSQFYFKQLPVLPPSTYTPELLNFIVPRVLELTYTAWDLQAFARDLGYEGDPFAWDPERRFQLRCELDALYFHLYQIGREDAAYIMDTFPILKRKDEAQFGTYRTKDVILAAYDQLMEAFATSS